MDRTCLISLCPFRPMICCIFHCLQEIVGGAGIELLVDIARESINPALHVFASKTVLNLRHNARNRTRLYKTELDVKTNDWSEKFGPQSQVGLQQQQQQTAGGAANLLGLDDSADATPREEDDVFMTAVDVTTKRASSPHSVVSFAPLPSSPGVSGVDNSLARLTVSRDGAASQQKTSRSGAGNSKGGGSTQRTVSTRAARAAACRDAFDQWFSELGVADDGGLVGAPPKAVSHTGPAQAKKKRTVSKPEPARLVKRKSEVPLVVRCWFRVVVWHRALLLFPVVLSARSCYRRWRLKQHWPRMMQGRHRKSPWNGS